MSLVAASPGSGVDDALRSATYDGTVLHRRPGAHGFSFKRPVRMALIDLEEIERLCRLHPLWSHRHRAPVEIRRSDYLGPPDLPLGTSVRDVVERETGIRPDGPIAMLTYPRTWGWLFNPISCYYCYGKSGTDVRFMVAEVTNTPWHERHCYVFGPPGVHHVDKEFHVSPFIDMDKRYRVAYSAPGGQLTVSITVTGGHGTVLHTATRLIRRPATGRNLGRLLWAPRTGSVGVSVGIYRHAAALRARGAKVFYHPDRVGPSREAATHLSGEPASGCTAPRSTEAADRG